MKIVVLIILAIFVGSISGAGICADLIEEEPVTNVRTYRVTEEQLIIYYDLGGEKPLHITVLVSQDGGNTFEIEPQSITGDVGPNIEPRPTRRIAWNAAIDGINLDDPVVIKVIADGERVIPGGVLAGDHPVITARYTDDRVKLDGLLTEQAWKTAFMIDEFCQREPIAGAEPTKRTTVRILYNHDALYIGVECFDSEPESIVHRELRRDGEIVRDDNICIALDPFNDQRTAFFFGLNPNGAMLDGEIQAVSLSPMNEDWDGVWNAAARITETGWSAEIVIPFKTLRFPNTAVQSWGFNIRRIVARSYEEMLWTGWGYNDGIGQVSKYGRLMGIRDVQGGRRFELKPYILGGREKSGGTIDDERKYGLDARYGITSNLTLDLTTHTDFAQVEVDREQINLTRFSLYYPEKRDFFLEGRQIFNFGGSGSDTPLFYSRRIGLTLDRRQVTIQGGGKLFGTIGDYEIGALAIRTGEDHDEQAATYSAVRLKRNLFTKSFIGAMATHRRDDNDHKNLAYGLDALLRTDHFLGDKNLELNAFVSGTYTSDAPVEQDQAVKVYLMYLNDTLEFYSNYSCIGEDFNPEMGFIARKGIKSSIHVIEFLPRVSMPFIRKLDIKPLWVIYTTDMNNRLLTRNYKPTLFGFETRNNDIFLFQFHETYEYLEDDFNIFGDVVIPAGVYEWWNRYVTVETSSSRLVSCNLSSMWGNFYNGERTNFTGEVLGKVTRYVGVSGNFEYNEVTLGRHGSFLTREVGCKLLLNLSPRISTSMYAQYNNETNEVFFNARFHWIPQIGSDCYIVYNEIWDEEDDFRSLQNTAILKIDYLFRF